MRDRDNFYKMGIVWAVICAVAVLVVILRPSKDSDTYHPGDTGNYQPCYWTDGDHKGQAAYGWHVDTDHPDLAGNTQCVEDK